MYNIKYSEKSQSYSRIIAGTMRWGQWGAQFSTKAYVDMIEGALELGITTIDHADIYGDYTTEAEFGEAFHDMNIDRSSVQLITKCGIRKMAESRPENTINSYDNSKVYILSSVEQSLKNLKTDYIDLLLIHRPSPLMDPSVLAEAFTELHKAGKVRDFGVSNYTASQFNLLNSYFPLVTNQIEISPVKLDYFHDGTIDVLMQNGLKPQAWSPIGGTQLFGGGGQNSEQVSRFQKLCEAYDWTISEMALLFLLHHPSGISPVLGTSKIKRLKEAVMSLDKSITDEQWFEIWTASTGHSVP